MKLSKPIEKESSLMPEIEPSQPTKLMSITKKKKDKGILKIMYFYWWFRVIGLKNFSES